MLAWIVQVDEDYAEHDLTEARTLGLYAGVNPTTGVRIPKGKKHGRKRLAYSLEEILKHLQLFTTDPIVTNLKELGVPDTTIQCILRHENVSTTQPTLRPRPQSRWMPGRNWKTKSVVQQLCSRQQWFGL